MAMRLTGVVIGASDLDAARERYQALLATAPRPLGDGGWRFALAPGAIDLVHDTPGLRAVRFAIEPGTAPPADFHGIDVRLESETDAAAPTDHGLAIDHVVVFTPDPERAIALWRDRVGLRLALDRVFEQRKLRLLFFRSGGMTLEYAHPLGGDRGAGTDGFYGVSYRVPNLLAHRDRLLAAGFDVSELRPGMKPGTSVASVRNHTAEVPTLLIQHPPRGGA
jgi:catechol 2,3-dioxygenase-like lactoylglutathione lyase family enzyme